MDQQAVKREAVPGSASPPTHGLRRNGLIRRLEHTRTYVLRPGVKLRS